MDIAQIRKKFRLFVFLMAVNLGSYCAFTMFQYLTVDSTSEQCELAFTNNQDFQIDFTSQKGAGRFKEIASPFVFITIHFYSYFLSGIEKPGGTKYNLSESSAITSPFLILSKQLII